MPRSFLIKKKEFKKANITYFGKFSIFGNISIFQNHIYEVRSSF